MKSYCLEVSGDFACFTRPEMKVERVSYDVMTPSAARAVFEAILWKPAIRWHVTRIEVLNPIRWVSIRRNEVGKTASVRGNIYIDDENTRQQRAGLILRDVAYRVYAHFELRDPGFHKPNFPRLSKYRITSGEDDLNALTGNNAAKFMSMFERRVAKGQCVNQPYLGCREFACAFHLVENSSTEPPPLNETRDLGFILYDLDYSNVTDPKPRFFRARLENGILNIPHWESGEVRG